MLEYNGRLDIIYHRLSYVSNIFDRIYIMYHRLLYVSECALPLNTFILYIYQPRGTINKQAIIQFFEGFTWTHSTSCTALSKQQLKLASRPFFVFFTKGSPALYYKENIHSSGSSSHTPVCQYIIVIRYKIDHDPLLSTLRK
jgi:hypothetical protein